MLNRFRFLAAVFTVGFSVLSYCEDAALAITTPTTRIVYQRNSENQAVIPITGTCAATATLIEARLLVRQNKPDTATAAVPWTPIDAAPKAGAFRGSLTAPGGWYNLEVRALAGAGKDAAGAATLERVGVGEVFVVIGHSVAQGQDINLPGATDDRVSTVSLIEEADSYDTYHHTADPNFLPPPVFVKFATGIKAAPYSHGTYFWARFAELVAQNQNVPVLLYNAAFGGTSLEHWSNASQGIQFQHSFVRAHIRMPYINLYNTLKKYVPLTGIRAVLADQGANDWPQKDANIVFNYYKTSVDQSRKDLGFENLAVVVNRHTPFFRDKAIREAQERMLKTHDCFPGPDYDIFAKEDRPDQIHIGEKGLPKAAKMWADALDADFFKNSKPYLPDFKAAK